jgi:hypothetical protein
MASSTFPSPAVLRPQVAVVAEPAAVVAAALAVEPLLRQPVDLQPTRFTTGPGSLHADPALFVS